MNRLVLKERIKQVCKITPMVTGPISVDVVQAQNPDGSIGVVVTPTTGIIYLNDELAEVIAEAVSTAVVEFLTQTVAVSVPNAAAGGVTLVGTLV